MVRTFIDSCLLLAAARGVDELAEKAMSILDDPDRDFVSSDFVALEILPKAVYHEQKHEVAFYRAFLQAVEESVPTSASLAARALREAELCGLSAVDALHVAAAREGDCDELATAEKSTKPLFRVRDLVVTTIRAK